MNTVQKQLQIEPIVDITELGMMGKRLKAIVEFFLESYLNHPDKRLGCDGRPSSRLTVTSIFNTYYGGFVTLYIFCGKYLLAALRYV